MCGRFNITADPLTQLLMELVGLGHPGPDNYNTAPTEQVAVLRMVAAGQPEIISMKWWLTPFWSREVSTKYSMFNARSEGLTKSPAFREPFKKRRCVVPVSGYYEWARKQSPKTPYYLNAEVGLLLAGLWDRWVNPETNEELLSFTIVTTAAHPAMEFVHHRQPVMLDIDSAKLWLTELDEVDDLTRLFTPSLPAGLQATPLSTYVNNARNKDARCVQPLGDSIILFDES